MKEKMNQKAWVVAMDMGYGHQRAAYPLSIMAETGTVVHADCYRGIPKKDREIWTKQREFYNYVSRFKQTPVVGNIAFSVFDYFQRIEPFYPKRDLSNPSAQLRGAYSLIRRKSWGKHLIDKLKKKRLPLITTFFVPAYMAEEHGYEGEIYLVVADADVARAWAPLKPSSSRIKYLVPTKRVYERMKLYGVLENNIFLTGFPLPHENVGGESLNILKHDLGRRIFHLDPKNAYIPKYRSTLTKHLGKKNLIKSRGRALTIMFAVGGAGAQRELGFKIAKSLRSKIRERTVRLILVAGVHKDAADYFRESLEKEKMGGLIGRHIIILYSADKNDYFRKFNLFLRKTDILWTKPSELSFYCALGLPVIMSEPIGSQEKFNRKWLRAIGAGIAQENVKHADEWLFDWLGSGWFAEAAMQGFFEAAKFGTYNIQKIVSHRETHVQEFKTVLQY